MASHNLDPHDPHSTGHVSSDLTASDDAFYAAESAKQIELSHLVDCEDTPELIHAWSEYQAGNHSRPFLVAGLDTQWVEHTNGTPDNQSADQPADGLYSKPTSADDSLPTGSSADVLGVAVCIVYDFVSNKVVHTSTKNIQASVSTSSQTFSTLPSELSDASISTSTTNINQPQQYRPGFLALREASHYIELITGLPEHFKPSVCLIDGGGRFHPRRAGLACAVGVATSLPTVGVAKTVLRCILQDDPDEKRVRAMMQTDEQDNQSTGDLGSSASSQLRRQLPLYDTAGLPLAYAVSPIQGKPVYLSVGHRISLETAAHVTTACQYFVNPEPLRLADIEARRRVRMLRDTQAVQNISTNKKNIRR